MMKYRLMFFFLFFSLNLFAQKTEKIYLSGKGSDDAKEWDFYCTGGRKSGYWTKIKVPSNWEFHGFGTFNYGFDHDKIRGKEMGLYKYRFTISNDWKGKIINIVFEGSMTDTEVKINGKIVGPVHMGAFYRFKYDITSYLHYRSENLLEVKVAKHSSNESVNRAERICDFWIFGGIFRPVYLEAMPKEHISFIAIDAKANGTFKLVCELKNITVANAIRVRVGNMDGNIIGQQLKGSLIMKQNRITLSGKFDNINRWSPEFPNRYKIWVELCENDKVIHVVNEVIGFRTVSLKPRDGIYVNGVKIKFKGVNRHSFWPTSGRALNFELNLRDAALIKEMNMNAVRMSHYPPDKDFLYICDSIGLFVINELAGWQKAYDTVTGAKLVKEFVHRDVNHPCIVLWANGNEGGWNFELDHFIDEYDIQKRPIIHPWQIFRNIDTQHYKDYDYGTGTHLNGRNIVLPTEFLHGLYDGGLGAGLEDYWRQMQYNPLSAGGFLWSFVDEGVRRNDLGGIIDTDGNRGPDGIVGPFREKEGSFYAIKEIWAPIFFEKKFITDQFEGKFSVENRYHYTNLNQCRFEYSFAIMQLPNEKNEKIIVSGTIPSPDIIPGGKGTLKMDPPKNWNQSDVLYITAFDPHGNEIYKWSWPVKSPKEVTGAIIDKMYQNSYGKPGYIEKENEVILYLNDIIIIFDKSTGILKEVNSGNEIIPLNNGPVLCEGEPNIIGHKIFANDTSVVFEILHEKPVKYQRWIMYSNGLLKLEFSYWPGNYTDFMGISFNFPEEKIKGLKWFGSGPYRVWKNRMKGNMLNVWENPYNNTITGEKEFIYPEFKGYLKDFYWAEIEALPKSFKVYCSNEDVFLRMLTPDKPQNARNDYTSPPFPHGDISFMHGISPIGTKFRKPENMGPMGNKNLFMNFWRRFSKDLELYFDFR